jgi:hypothetical protein
VSASLFISLFVGRNLRLFAKNKDAILAGKADFFDLAIFADQHGVCGCFRTAVFPASFRLGDQLFALLDSRFVAVDLEAIFAGLQFGFAELCGMGDADGLVDGLGDNGHRAGERSGKRQIAKNGMKFHACQLPFERIESAAPGSRRLNRVDTHVEGE